MGNADAEITRGVSQMSGHTSVPLTDDLLNTKSMTIEDLIESDKEVVECVDSCSNADPVATPTNKSGVKRGYDVDDTAADVELEVDWLLPPSRQNWFA